MTMNMTLTQLQNWLPDAVAMAGAVNANPIIQAVRTDSRSVVAGDLFIALKGETFDGAKQRIFQSRAWKSDRITP
jgi:UDP-N-acetylmuramoyl-tripeptide--D-alanyl-D-alanine ligase